MVNVAVRVPAAWAGEARVMSAASGRSSAAPSAPVRRRMSGLRLWNMALPVVVGWYRGEVIRACAHAGTGRWRRVRSGEGRVTAGTAIGRAPTT
ncbi:hypothetical protein GCM10010508_17220 [Streptomyces naganishii JCM 4654]|uniref:Uncharacterized protein n=1 Tax=Streptomyces naganishii JCM 4654 TaxID=1306179 RepID=A0A918Y2I0_9ACTN|nr:hypothetical protein GCM10010508_17220 [Streptomyces naganishii JCM 4654]